MLTEQQKHEFKTFGFLRLKDFIQSDEMRLYVDIPPEPQADGAGHLDG